MQRGKVLHIWFAHLVPYVMGRCDTGATQETPLNCGDTGMFVKCAKVDLELYTKTVPLTFRALSCRIVFAKTPPFHRHLRHC